MQVIINAGSSSLKWAVYHEETQVLKGVFDRLGDACELRIQERSERVPVASHEHAVQYLLRLLSENKIAQPEDITQFVHRVVHGGETYSGPVVVTDEVLDDIKDLSVLAPLHNPANRSGILACKHAAPQAQHVTVFDTAFHHTIAPEVFLYGIPYELYEKYRIRKYGFHGTSHQYIATTLAKHYGRDAHILSCHLGSGSSITAVRNGTSVDTTMGFTPLDGLLMSTRTGELDPEIPLFLLKHGHYTPQELEELFNTRSGLLGLTGHKDLRDIYALAQQGDERCQLAIDMLSYRVAYYLSALRVATPDLAAIAFTGGIGEGAWYVRKQACELLGIPLDDEQNRKGAETISAPNSDVRVHIIAADEEYMMHTLAQGLEDKQYKHQ